MVIIAQDNSESVASLKDSGFYKGEYQRNMQQFAADLSKKYDVRTYTFGEKVTNSSSFAFNEKQTDISGVFNEIAGVYGNRNVGAVVLASDGLYNKGSSPLYAAEKLKFPVYTLALGDTNVRKDIILTKVNHNRFAYLGNKFPLEVVIDAKQCRGKTTELTIEGNEGKVFSKTIDINANFFTTTESVQLDAKKPGMQHYKVKLSTIEDEVSYANNATDVFIEVLDGRQKVLILGLTPHPDIGAIRQAIESNENYEVDVSLADNFDKKINQYNLVILHQIPANNLSGTAQKLLADIQKSDIPLLYILGDQTAFIEFNKLKTGVEIFRVNNASNEIQPSLVDNFALFTLSDEVRRNVVKFPPLSGAFGEYKTSGSAIVLFNQRIGLVESKQPLLFFNQQGERKTGVLTGEGIWKWRLNDFSLHGNHAVFNELVSKIVQYLSVKTDKSLFRVINKNIFYENEPLLFDGELYNESYELINAPDVSMEITNSENKKFQFVFSKTAKAYRLDAGIFPVGEYKFEAKVKSGAQLHTVSRSFIVSALHLESLVTVADHQLLFNISAHTGAAMFYPAELSKLKDAIMKREDIKPVVYNQKKLKDAINLKWIFFLILALLAFEWFLRKRNGGY